MAKPCAYAAPVPSATRSTVPDVPPAPSASTAPTGTEPAEPRGRRAVRVTASVATVGVLVALVGLALSARPLSTPTQDCGTALTFLAQGRVDEFVDPADPPAGLTRADALANAANPCQERAANRARPAGALLVGGTLLALAMAVVEGSIRYSINRGVRRSWLTTGAPQLPSPPAHAPPSAPPPPPPGRMGR